MPEWLQVIERFGWPLAFIVGLKYRWWIMASEVAVLERERQDLRVECEEARAQSKRQAGILEAATSLMLQLKP